MFLTPSNASHHTIEWSAGASEDSPIVWETSGISEEGVREGKVAVTIDGKNSYHTLLDKITPGLWDVKLSGITSGGSTGVTRVSISSERFSRELDPHNLGKQVTPYLQFFRCGEFDVVIYEMNLPGQEVAWLKKGWSCGTGGCGIWLEIIHHESEAAEEKCEV